MSDERPDTNELRQAQSRREAEEQALASSAEQEQEAAIHRRRADKAHYLRKKLEERAESEREAPGTDSSSAEEASGPEAEE